MKKNIIIVLLLAINIPSYAQKQYLYELLDIAYTDFCNNKYPDNNISFVTNFCYFSQKKYNIENTCEVITMKINNHEHNLRKRAEIIDTPMIYLFKDNIIIVNSSMWVTSGGKYWFALGPNYFTHFKLDDNTGQWIYEKSIEPELNFRDFGTTFNEILKKCVTKAIEEIKEQKGSDFISYCLIEDNMPYLNFGDDNLQINRIEKGLDLSYYKQTFDYFIGYPEAFLEGNTICVSIKIIPSRHINKIKSKDFKRFKTATIKVSFDDKILLQ